MKETKIKKTKEQQLSKINDLTNDQINDQINEQIDIGSCITPIISNEHFAEEIIEDILSNLDTSRLHNYDDWKSIGMALKNINKNYYSIYDKWSKKSERYNEKGNKKLWDGFKENEINGLNMGSLLYWLKEDNPEKCEEIKKKIKEQRQQRKKSMKWVPYAWGVILRPRPSTPSVRLMT